MNTIWDILFLRSPVLNYVSPPICEVIFSGSSSPVIVLSYPQLARVTGLVLGGSGGFRLSWNAFPGAICYNVYFVGGDNVAVLLAQCIPDPVFDLPEGLGDGEVVVTAITPDGETPASEPIMYPGGGGGGCVPDEGEPAPEGAEAFSIPTDEDTGDPIPIVRDQMDFSPTDFIPVMGGVDRYQSFTVDAPPGHYNVGYVSGFIGPRPSSFPSNCGQVAIYYVTDVEKGFDNFTNFIANGVYTVDPPEAGPFGSGIGFCGVDNDTIEAQFQAYFNTPGARKQWKFDQRHENTGGPISAVYDANQEDPPGTAPTSPVGYQLVISLIQVDGLIQQPRKVRVAGWEIIKTNFPPAIRDNWDGTFPVRTTYTETELLYTAAPAGDFPGATCYYTQTHPTAPNGCGWVVEIGTHWTGLREVGDQPTGTYIQSAPVAPGCMTIEEYE